MAELNSLLEHPLYLVILIFGITLLIQIYFYLFYYLRILFYNNKKHKNAEKEPVSVIICARNEEKNLEENLPSVLTQNYPDYEVIVVNDCSEDESEFVLERLKKTHKHLKITTIKKDEKFIHNKKLALTIGIKAAKNEILLLTDADCKPESNQWIDQMQSNLYGQKSIVLGYGGYESRKTILNNLIRFDTLFIAIQYFAYAIAGKPYMGVGRNLAYKKRLFFDNKGFAKHHHLESGDDDLFVNQVANKKNTAVEISSKAKTQSKPETKFSDWFKQKKRHTTTGKLYRFGSQWRLFLEQSSRFFYYISFILSLILFTQFYLYILIAFIFRSILQLTIVKVTMKRLNEKNLLLPSLIYDIILPWFNIVFVVSNIFTSKKNRWR
ncbi:MAG TPA: glycosyltransferase [Bacteroidales bacterium]|nr:glycosyltransferase [Bacteroidales bacterium]